MNTHRRIKDFCNASMCKLYQKSSWTSSNELSVAYMKLHRLALYVYMSCRKLDQYDNNKFDYYIPLIAGHIGLAKLACSEYQYIFTITQPLIVRALPAIAIENISEYKIHPTANMKKFISINCPLLRKAWRYISNDKCSYHNIAWLMFWLNAFASSYLAVIANYDTNSTIYDKEWEW